MLNMLKKLMYWMIFLAFIGVVGLGIKSGFIILPTLGPVDKTDYVTVISDQSGDVSEETKQKLLEAVVVFSKEFFVWHEDYYHTNKLPPFDYIDENTRYHILESLTEQAKRDATIMEMWIKGKLNQVEIKNIKHHRDRNEYEVDILVDYEVSPTDKKRQESTVYFIPNIEPSIKSDFIIVRLNNPKEGSSSYSTFNVEGFFELINDLKETIISKLDQGEANQDQQPKQEPSSQDSGNNTVTQDNNPANQVSEDKNGTDNAKEQVVEQPTESNGLKLQQESEHFIFYSEEKDKSALADLSQVLESNYQRVVSNLGITINHKIKVEIYPDVDSLHIADGRPDAADWSVGSGVNKELIRMVSPLYPKLVHDYDSMMEILVHEFVHVLQHNLTANLYATPKWLSEGLAIYEAGQFNKNQLLSFDIPTLKFLANTSDTPEWGEKGGYAFSYTIIEYIIKNYGYEKMRQLFITPDLQKVLGVTEEEFEVSWKNYLEDTYF